MKLEYRLLVDQYYVLCKFFFLLLYRGYKNYVLVPMKYALKSYRLNREDGSDIYTHAQSKRGRETEK